MRPRFVALAVLTIVGACGAPAPDTGAGTPAVPTSRPDPGGSTSSVDVTVRTFPVASTAAPVGDADTTAAGGDVATSDVASDPWDALIVSGTIEIATVQVTRISAQTLPSRHVEFTDAVTGICLLELFDDEGGLLEAAGFTPEPDSEVEYASFRIAFPLPEVGVGRAVVSCEGEEIGSVEAGPSAPTVSITTPRAGDTFMAETDSVTWIGSDADGDDLTYMLLYSTDDGASWQALTAPTPETEMTFGELPLQGADQARFLVIASDGLNSGHVVSESFTLISDAPVIAFSVSQPFDGQVFTGRQMVTLAASVVPYAGAVIGDLTVEWSSDVDGSLGTVEVGDGGNEYRIDLVATDLSEGIHVITATIIDDNTLLASETVSIEIRRSAPAAPSP